MSTPDPTPTQTPTDHIHACDCDELRSAIDHIDAETDRLIGQLNTLPAAGDVVTVQRHSITGTPLAPPRLARLVNRDIYVGPHSGLVVDGWLVQWIDTDSGRETHGGWVAASAIHEVA